MSSAFFVRSESLLGADKLSRLCGANVLVVGVGGVGSWCAEALLRTGIGHLTLVDDDTVVESNVNRQCPATSLTIGRHKVEVMAERLREINPDSEVIAMASRYPMGMPCDFRLDSYDVVVDAIDSVDCKARLILDAFASNVPIVCSMGAALRTDPTQVRIARFDKVMGDGLAKALRNRFRKLNQWPGRFNCVFSEEPSLKVPHDGLTGNIKGSIMPVTATFGMCLASEVLKSIPCDC